MKYLIFAIGLVTFSSGLVASADDRSVDFDRDIRPILSDNCYACHGPVEAHRDG